MISRMISIRQAWISSGVGTPCRPAAGDGDRGELGGKTGGFPGIAGGRQAEEESGGKDIAGAGGVDFAELWGL